MPRDPLADAIMALETALNSPLPVELSAPMARALLKHLRELTAQQSGRVA